MTNRYPLVFATAATASANYPSDSGYAWTGGAGYFVISGTYNGATIKLQIKYPNTSTWIDLPGISFTALTGTPVIVDGIPDGVYIRMNIANVGGSTSLSATLLPTFGTGTPPNNMPVTLAAGTAAIGSVTGAASTSGGWTPYHLVSAASTNATSLKASAGQIGYIICFNVNAAIRYLKLYNKASSPTVGTDTPVHTIGIPGGSTAGAGISAPIPIGIEFSTGIAFALTTEATDAGTTGVAANEIVVNIGYK